jgi:hypothetical protein
MAAKAKIENLTNMWYGFMVYSSLATLLVRGIGVWNLATGAMGLFFSLLWVWFWGRRLVNKGHLSRTLLIGASGLFTALGAWGAAQSTWAFVNAWELQFIIKAISSAVTAWMMAKSFRVLTDASVKAYFA